MKKENNNVERSLTSKIFYTTQTILLLISFIIVFDVRAKDIFDPILRVLRDTFIFGDDLIRDLFFIVLIVYCISVTLFLVESIFNFLKSFGNTTLLEELD